MAPVECTKWMLSTCSWDCTLKYSYSGVHCVSRLPVDCSGVLVFTVELLWTVFEKFLSPPTPPAQVSSLVRSHSYYAEPKISMHLQKIA